MQASKRIDEARCVRSSSLRPQRHGRETSSCSWRTGRARAPVIVIGRPFRRQRIDARCRAYPARIEHDRSAACYTIEFKAPPPPHSNPTMHHLSLARAGTYAIAPDPPFLHTPALQRSAAQRAPQPAWQAPRYFLCLHNHTPFLRDR